MMYWNYEIPYWPRPYALDKFSKEFSVITASAARYQSLNHTMYKYQNTMTEIH